MRFRCYEQLLVSRGAAVCEIEHPPPPGADVECEGPIRGTIKLTNVGSHIRAVGTLRVAVRVSCSRCLTPMLAPVEMEIDEECELTQIDEPDAYEATAEDIAETPILDDDIIDLSELVRQNLVVNLPTSPLCRPECPGLCPQCGQNLNEGQCDCSTEHIDPRLAKLRELLDGESTKGSG